MLFPDNCSTAWVLTNRFCGSPFIRLGNCRRFCSSRSTRVQQNSTCFTISAQKIQRQSLTSNKIPQTSTGSRIWFGTRGSEVQILSPRPIFSSRWIAFLDLRLQRCSRFCRRCGFSVFPFDVEFNRLAETLAGVREGSGIAFPSLLICSVIAAEQLRQSQ